MDRLQKIPLILSLIYFIPETVLLLICEEIGCLAPAIFTVPGIYILGFIANIFPDQLSGLLSDKWWILLAAVLNAWLIYIVAVFIKFIVKNLPKD